MIELTKEQQIALEAAIQALVKASAALESLENVDDNGFLPFYRIQANVADCANRLISAQINLVAKSE